MKWFFFSLTGGWFFLIQKLPFRHQISGLGWIFFSSLAAKFFVFVFLLLRLVKCFFFFFFLTSTAGEGVFFSSKNSPPISNGASLNVIWYYIFINVLLFSNLMIAHANKFLDKQKNLPACLVDKLIYLTIIHGMWRRMYVPQSLENPCTDLDQNRTTYSPWPPNGYRGVGVKVIQGQRSLWGKILKLAAEFNQFAGEFNRGHQRSFQGHHHILETPAPIVTKLAPGVALAPPMVVGGSGSRSPKVKGYVGVKS